VAGLAVLAGLLGIAAVPTAYDSVKLVRDDPACLDRYAGRAPLLATVIRDLGVSNETPSLRYTRQYIETACQSTPHSTP
jgi:hypothetical protein